jgi:TetR/AcrR family transcriptional repressor of nem operon
MKVSREQVAENRERIIAAAGRLFRERGFDSVTVADVMRAAGLTHGAFYGYFPSKEALIAASINESQAARARELEHLSAAEYADAYLGVRHRDDPGGGCAFAGLGGEAARGSDELRRGLTESLRRQIDRFGAGAKGAGANEKRRAAISAWSAMVGAATLARIVDDESLSKEILEATRASLPFD